MISDIFVEQLVKRKKSGADYVRVIFSIVAALVLVFIMVVGNIAIPFFGFFVFIICAGLIYLLYIFVTRINLEYEYAFTNGDLDVDKIINVRSRKRLADINAREIEYMAKISDPAFRQYDQNAEIKKIYACEDKRDPDTFFVIYLDDSDKKMLFFNPNEKIQEGFRRYNPQKVVLDA